MVWLNRGCGLAEERVWLQLVLRRGVAKQRVWLSSRRGVARGEDTDLVGADGGSGVGGRG